PPVRAGRAVHRCRRGPRRQGAARGRLRRAGEPPDPPGDQGARPVVGPRPGGLTGELLARTAFPPAGTPLTCGVSGGADSLALLVLAAAAGCEVTAVHVDHGLRPGSAAEAGVVAAAAGRVGAAFRA